MAEEEKKITHQEIERLIREEGLDIKDVIDVVIKINGLAGVGLFSLGRGLQEFVHDKLKNTQNQN